MKKLLILFTLVTTCYPNAFNQTNYWQQQVNNTIDVTLNDKDHTLDGFIKIDYFNHSPDTLRYIWFHLWPNAYKNDRTAFSDQSLEIGRTDFYFSDEDKRGYINRLDFKVNGSAAITEDHPVHQDIVKLLLPQPLSPGGVARIQTPFHVKLPFNFSRGGHVGQSYQITQWYPKPAVYDKQGWHAMPYLQLGEFYSEFGNFEVSITLPKNYVVAATGELQDTAEMRWLHSKIKVPVTCYDCGKTGNQQIDTTGIASSREIKTIHFRQDSIHDFAWFADKRFRVYKDTVRLESGRILSVYSYTLPKITENNFWVNSTAYIKKAILTRSKWMGEYPYNIASVVEAELGFPGGMEYPTITSISPVSSEPSLETLIGHEVGHNWNYGVLANNEREHPWMDEGINSYYDFRYNNSERLTAREEIVKSSFLRKRMPADLFALGFRTMASMKKDQPIETASENFSELNYGLVGYYKAAAWMNLLEVELGSAQFDRCMQEFYRRWKFKHPGPKDLQAVFEETSGKNLDPWFSLLSTKGELPAEKVKRKIRLQSFFSFKDTDKFRYVFVAPLAGINYYDKLMLGGIMHNYSLPAEKFQFLVAPLYAIGSKQLNGLGRLSYHWYPGQQGAKAELSLSAATFSADSFTDSAGFTTYQRFGKLVPSLKLILANKDPRSHVQKYFQWKTYFVQEVGLLFTRDTVHNTDIISYPATSRFVNQLRFVIDNNRVLYPYYGEVQLEQGEGFARLALTGNYFFNYPSKGGMNVRVFAGKFFYLGDNTYIKQSETSRYHLNMTGPKGDEDYTYSNYFIGRNEFEKYRSQQIMQRDGFFKVRTDLLSTKVGKTDNWLSAANFTTDIPDKINPLALLPVKIPLKVFLDIGSFAEAWETAGTGKFIYDAGLQLSLFKNIVNIYLPLLYSKVYRDYFNSTITENRFWKNISFSIDIQNISLKKQFPQLPF